MNSTEIQKMYAENPSLSMTDTPENKKLDLSLFQSLYEQMLSLSEKLDNEDKKFEKATLVGRAIYTVL